MKKLTKVQLAKLNGYAGATVFYQWLGTKATKATTETKFRYEALLIGSTLLSNGFGLSASLALADKNIELEKEINNLRDKYE